jgi:hypothetical protein
MGKRASQLQDLPLAQQRSACPREASSSQIIGRHCWHLVVLPPMSSTGTLASLNSKRGRKLLCANLADPALAGATHGRDPVVAGAASMSTKHELPPVARSGGIAPATAPGLSTGHGPRQARYCCRSWSVSRAWASACYSRSRSRCCCRSWFVSRARASACCSQSQSRYYCRAAMDMRSTADSLFLEVMFTATVAPTDATDTIDMQCDFKWRFSCTCSTCQNMLNSWIL